MPQNKQIYAIPLPEHLVKFIQKEFWEGYKPPFPVDEGSLIGKQIFTILVDQRAQDPVIPEVETFLQIRLSTTLAKRSPDLVKLSRINRYLEEHFKSCLIIWVKAQMQAGMNRYQSVIGFLGYYDIMTDDLVDRYYQYVKRCNYIPYRIHKNEKEKEQNQLAQD